MEAKHSDDQLGRARVQSTPELEQYYNELEQLGAGALWTVANDIEPWEPRSSSVPMLWKYCLLYTSPSPRDRQKSRMPSSA